MGRIAGCIKPPASRGGRSRSRPTGPIVFRPRACAAGVRQKNCAERRSAGHLTTGRGAMTGRHPMVAGDPGCVVVRSPLRATQPRSHGRVGIRRWTENREDERSSQHGYSLKTAHERSRLSRRKVHRDAELGHGQSSQQFLKNGSLWLKFKETCHDSILATDSHLAVSVTESLFSPGEFRHRQEFIPAGAYECRI